MFEFTEAMFNELMCVIVLEVVKDNWECASRDVEFGVTFVTESAAKLASDMIVVAYFLVYCFVELNVTARTMCA